jgi:two-component system response regulator
LIYARLNRLTLAMSDPILYVEDGPDDVFFMQRAFKKVAPTVDLRIFTNGQEAANFFLSNPSSENLDPPLALVILDLNLPGQFGLQILQQIRTKSKYGKVPVILFSASSQQSDIDSCYAAGCNAYLVKPHDPERLREMVTVINEFWLKENRYSKTPGDLAIVLGDLSEPVG